MTLRIYNAGEETSYELLEELRRGGEGRTFRAQQFEPTGHGWPVAVKILTPENYLSRKADRDVILQQWRQQMHVMRGFGHAGFASVHVAFPIAAPPDASGDPLPEEWLGTPAFVMAWVDGDPLDRWRAYPDTAAARLSPLRTCAEGLDAFHEETRHVHRDLKPSNIMVTPHGRGRIIDYGLVRSFDQLRSRSALLGTEGYLAPELYEGAEYSATTDLYAFAGVIFFQLTGQNPHPARNAAAIRAALTEAGAGEAGNLVESALSRDPGFRPSVSGATELLSEVEAKLPPSGRGAERQADGRARRIQPAPPAPTAPTQTLPPDKPPLLTPTLMRALLIAAGLCLATIVLFVLLS